MRWSSTLKYICKRLLMSIAVLFIVTVMIFVIVRLSPGDPVQSRIGPYGDYSEENVARIEKELGLDKPMVVQYGIWLKDCLSGNLGVSLRNGASITEIVFDKLAVSLELITVAILLAILIAIPLGIISGIKSGSPIDQAASVFSTGFLAMPSFCTGLLLIVVFSVKLKILPSNGYVPFFENPEMNIKYLILPALTLGLYLIAVLTRFVRSETMEVVSSNYVRTARAKGMPSGIVNKSHILKNISTTLVTVVGIEFATLLGGTVIVEQLFGWSGLGWYICQSVSNRDYPAVQGSVLIIAVAFVLINLLMDILYVILDPRIELE
ncbi:MAG: ABC transporter permease [Ruminococcaceae bacterium]|nr:ABC transporter permease [Oscillospiraceae bacterium]